MGVADWSSQIAFLFLVRCGWGGNLLSWSLSRWSKYGLHYRRLGCTYSANKVFQSSMWQLFKISLRNRGDVLLAGEHSWEPRPQIPVLYTQSWGENNFLLYFTFSHVGGCAADRATQPSCLSDSFLPIGEDAEAADFAAKPFHSLCAQHKCHGFGKPLLKGATRTQSHPTLFFLYFFIESFIKENRSLNLTSTDLQKAPGVGKWQLLGLWYKWKT